MLVKLPGLNSQRLCRSFQGCAASGTSAPRRLQAASCSASAEVRACLLGRQATFRVLSSNLPAAAQVAPLCAPVAAQPVTRCAVCSSAAEAVFRGACQHVCCWRCWGASHNVCTRCGVRTPKHELERIYFA